MYPTNILKDAPAPGGKDLTQDEMIVDANSFTGVFPEHLKHKYEIVKHLQCLVHLCVTTGDSANKAPALFCANIGISVGSTTDPNCGGAGIGLAEPSLSTM
jgi:magnesium-transporting ATPase (P-type)